MRRGWNGRRTELERRNVLRHARETDEPGIEMAVTLAPWNAVLRDWQTRAVADVLANPREDYLVTATGGGENPLCARIAHHYLAARAAGRVVVVCPTNHLRTQWASAAGQVGIQLDPALSNDQALEATGLSRRSGDLSNSKVCLAPEVFRRACRSRKTLVILDELHHAGDGKDWGKALRESFAEAVFAPRLVRHALSVR